VTCNACLAIAGFEEHKCLENKFESNCPICNQNMFNSIKSVSTMLCGHGIHIGCLREYEKTNFKCPMCSKSIADMSATWRDIDEEIRAQPMPPEFGNMWAYVLCNDCEAKTFERFHFVGIKCGKCDGYNTSILKTTKKEAGVEGVNDANTDKSDNNNNDNNNNNSNNNNNPN